MKKIRIACIEDEKELYSLIQIMAKGFSDDEVCFEVLSPIATYDQAMAFTRRVVNGELVVDVLICDMNLGGRLATEFAMDCRRVVPLVITRTSEVLTENGTRHMKAGNVFIAKPGGERAIFEKLYDLAEAGELGRELIGETEPQDIERMHADYNSAI